MFEVQFRAKDGFDPWSTYWTSDDGKDASDVLQQMTQTYRQSEWRLVWVHNKSIPSSQRVTKVKV